VRSASAEVRTGRPIDIGSVRTSVREIVKDIMAGRSIAHNLSWMKGMDEYTFVHALHICILAIELGRELGLTGQQLEELGTATLLHDVGKIFVPLEILRKPGKLDPDEFKIISRHPVDGAIMLAQDRNVPMVAAIVAYEHHIHLDYSGYPVMNKRRPLHMYSLMTSIVDIYDALTTVRPYRPPLPPRTALAVMQEQLTSRLEPRLLLHFTQMLGRYPCGTMLRTDSGRLVVVTQHRPDTPDNPIVKVVDLQPDKVQMGETNALGEFHSGFSDPVEVDPAGLGLDLALLMQRTATAETEQRAA
jgi:HD-GYP domain-containing protein (c-di-GMP phosphodiesterase class II)